jgi:CheY-like chemotaxis protein
MMAHSAHLTSGRILVVDDNLRLLRSTAFLLTVVGFEVTTATNAAEAVETFGRGRPNLIVCDAEMPEKGGYEFLNKVRNRKTARHIPFIMTSTQYQLHDLMNALDFGADDLIPKPFDIYDLLDAIKRAGIFPRRARKAS